MAKFVDGPMKGEEFEVPPGINTYEHIERDGLPWVKDGRVRLIYTTYRRGNFGHFKVFNRTVREMDRA